MKKKIILGFAVLAIAAVAAFNINLNTNQKSDMSLLALANVEALAGENNGSTKWFSNLNWVECPISKTNGPVGFYFKGV